MVKPTAAAGPRAGATFRVTANSTLLGIVLRDMAPPLLMECIRAVHAGERGSSARRSAAHFSTLLRREAGARELARVLTNRELDIVRMVLLGRCSGYSLILFSRLL
jgi:DNA-binding NarL/FixJ family response regulator